MYVYLCGYWLPKKSGRLMEINAMICVSTCMYAFLFFLGTMPIQIAKKPDRAKFSVA